MSNSGFQKSHDHLWHTPDGNRTMAIQFLLNTAESRKFNYFAKKLLKNNLWMYITAQNIAETYNKILNEFFTQYKQMVFKLFIYMVYYIFLV